MLKWAGQRVVRKEDKKLARSFQHRRWLEALLRLGVAAVLLGPACSFLVGDFSRSGADGPLDGAAPGDPGDSVGTDDSGDSLGPGDRPGDPTGLRALLTFSELLNESAIGLPIYDFWPTQVHTAKAHLFLVRNIGNGPATQLEPIKAAPGSPFVLAGATPQRFPGEFGSCGETLAPQKSCAVAIAFVPADAGHFEETFTLTYMDGATDQVASIRLRGRGVVELLARQVATGDRFNCAILTDGTVRCWGRNDFGMLGYGDTENRGDGPGEMGANLLPVDFGQGRTVAQIVCGHESSCALLDNHRVKCWGDNDDGCLGLGDTEDRGDEPGEMGDALPYVDLGTDCSGAGMVCRVNAIAAGTGSYCALLSDQTIRCWGDNDLGGLGLGDQEHRGDGPNEMGNNLPRLDVGSNRFVRQLAGLESGFCALLDDNTVKCWGGNTYGELGQGDTKNRGDESGEMGDNLPVVDLGTGRFAKRLFGSTQFFVCALLDDNSLKCWGRNDSGQLGQGDVVARGDELNEMGDNLPPIELGTGHHAVSAFLGSSHVCAILDNHQLKCWGNNSYGALGLGEPYNRGNNPDEMGDELPKVELGTGLYAISGAAGGDHTCAVLDDNRVKCWGRADYGEIGSGSTAHLGNDLNEMGDSLPRVDLGLDH